MPMGRGIRSVRPVSYTHLFNFNEYNKKCGDLFRYIELNQPNEITLIHKKEKIRIVLSWAEWRSVYAGQEDKLDVFLSLIHI